MKVARRISHEANRRLNDAYVSSITGDQKRGTEKTCRLVPAPGRRDACPTLALKLPQ